MYSIYWDRVHLIKSYLNSSPLFKCYLWEKNCKNINAFIPVIPSWEIVMTCFHINCTFISYLLLILKTTIVEETAAEQKINMFSLHRQAQWKIASMKCFRNVHFLKRMCSIFLSGIMISALHQPQRNMAECSRPEDCAIYGLK